MSIDEYLACCNTYVAILGAISKIIEWNDCMHAGCTAVWPLLCDKCIASPTKLTVFTQFDKSPCSPICWRPPYP